ncbi:STAS domain-containing protein [Miltoncostaea oceani]|uniref:STAS domain-containing protein n=1 Tax=Miltoncostaea oceani TaxID=2843216 RepID=UPI001C3CA4AA|nr:STAS domain-containing protein [Miltoncostaea oceani]
MPDDLTVPLGHVLNGRIEHDDGVAMLSLTGEFDLASVAAADALLAQIEATRPRAIAVDLQALTFLDSSGVKVLIDAHNRSLGERLFAVLSGSGPPRHALTITGVHRFLTVVSSIDELHELFLAEGAEASE